MFNPSMFEQAKKNMSKDQMKQAAEMMSKMSDAELLNYARMSGMPITDVNMMRQSANMMKSMDDQQFESYKNMAQNMNYPGFQQNTNTNTQPSQQPNPTSEEYKILEKLKAKGNEFFKQGKYQEASTQYTECLLEIEEIKAKEHIKNKSELDTIEVSVRMNLANAKAKLEDYEAVLTQAKTVLRISENGKAYFRAGQALFHFGKNRAALEHLEKAKQILNDDTVVELYNKVKDAVSKETPETKEKSETYSSDTHSKTEEFEETKGSDNQKKPKMKKKNIEEGGETKYTPPINQTKPKDTFRDTKIEEEKVEYKPNPTQSQPQQQFTAPPFSAGLGDKMDPNTIKKSQEQLKNMDPEQLKTMTDTFKTMDNSFIRQMMKSQTGMDMSDEDIQRMKSFMSPDMLKNMSNIDPSTIPNMPRRPNQTSSSGTGSNPTVNTASTNPSSTTGPAQPNINDMMAGGMPNISGDMIKNMIDMLSNNPEMLKSMAHMLGENNPLANMIKNKSPEDLKKLMVWVKRGSKVVLFFSPVYRIIKNYWQLIIGLLVGYILYSMFGN